MLFSCCSNIAVIHSVIRVSAFALSFPEADLRQQYRLYVHYKCHVVPVCPLQHSMRDVIKPINLLLHCCRCTACSIYEDAICTRYMWTRAGEQACLLGRALVTHELIFDLAARKKPAPELNNSTPKNSETKRRLFAFCSRQVDTRSATKGERPCKRETGGKANAD